jgi:hypothetical protein
MKKSNAIVKKLAILNLSSFMTLYSFGVNATPETMTGQTCHHSERYAFTCGSDGVRHICLCGPSTLKLNTTCMWNARPGQCQNRRAIIWR